MNFAEARSNIVDAMIDVQLHEDMSAQEKRDKLAAMQELLDDDDLLRTFFEEMGEEIKTTGVRESHGPPPRPGLVWNDSTKRWRNPHTGEEHPEHPVGQDVQIPPLHAKAVAAIDGAKATGLQHQKEALDRVSAHVAKNGQQLTHEQITAKLTEAFERAEVTANFHPTPELIDKFIADPNFRSVFETQATGVGGKVDVTDYLKRRDEWESGKISEHASAVPSNQRPKYFAVNWFNEAKGAADLYGSGVFVLNKDAFKDRMTIAPGNTSWTEPKESAAASEPANSFARSQRALYAAGLQKSADDPVPGARGMDAYTEVHVWGHMPIGKDTIKEIRVAKPRPWQLSQKKALKKLKEFSEKTGIPLKII